MVDAQNKIVSIEAFRAMRPSDRVKGTIHRGPADGLSPRSIEHRERMLRFLRLEAAEGAPRLERHDTREVQGRLLL